MEGQIQILDASPDLDIDEIIQMAKPQLLTMANEGHLQLLTAGGGAKDLRVRKLSTQHIVHLVVHVGNAMGANVINTMVEKIGPKIAELVGGTCGIKIVSNLCDQRLVTAK